DIGAPVLSAECRRGIEQVLPVLQIEDGIPPVGLFIAGRQVNHEISARREKLGSEAFVEAKPALLACSPAFGHPRIVLWPRLQEAARAVYDTGTPCAAIMSSGTARPSTVTWSCWPLAIRAFPSWSSPLRAGGFMSTRTAA